jgi:acyl-CoA reductase-like NAD-dependent aldehyde dehydrogenase
VLTTDPRVDVITFTGSTRVGWMLRAAAPSKKVLLELGNSAPAIVHRDADLDSAAAKITAGAFGFAGQSCVSVQRVYAHRSVVEELQDLLVAKAGAVETGSPANEKVLTGPVIDDAARDRLTNWMDQAVSAGARLLVGGDVDGRVIEPTILADIPADQPLAQEEAFGPVYGLASYDDIEDAYAVCNGTRFALQASVFTNNLRVALDATRRLKFGGVLVNEAPTFRTDAMPYGGGKDSGNTKEGPASTVAELTEERLVVIDQSATPSHT